MTWEWTLLKEAKSEEAHLPIKIHQSHPDVNRDRPQVDQDREVSMWRALREKIQPIFNQMAWRLFSQ
jgi:hypothetical protein